MSAPPPSHLPAPPGVWIPARRLARAFQAPVERFLSVEASSGIVLLLAAVLALGWANSPWAASYEALWTTPVTLGLGDFAFVRDLRWWVNDGLMVIFFFVVGLEIRREIHAGELSELKRAALPLAAALGGMIVPALIYTAFNAGTPAAVGWGVPMATDIAFAVGVFALLGDRVAPALRILLLALAVIDDLGAILVIALFYSDGVALGGLLVGAAGLAAILGLQAVGVRAVLAYVPPALVAWAGVYASGVHPTIAGVLVGLMTPVAVWIGPDRFVEEAEHAVREVKAAIARGEGDVHTKLGALRFAAEEATAPVERVQHALHGWVAYGIMPVFALANAGVALGAARLDGEGWRILLGVGLGLVVGKIVGVWGLARVAVAMGLASAPRGVGWSQVSAVGVAAGIGFTMSLFIAQLAFPAGPLLETAKLGILVASGVAAVLALVVGRLVLTPPAPEAARSLVEAESSTHV